jgi:DNA/RNA endonuclease YhcR with UshA esterase domain
LDRTTELGGYPGEEVSEGGKSIGLQLKRESPEKMGKLIQNYQIVFIARKTEYRGAPEITMNQVKSLLSTRRRGSERETSMSVKLTSMTEAPKMSSTTRRI